jgi:hypothetical protein
MSQMESEFRLEKKPLNLPNLRVLPKPVIVATRNVDSRLKWMGRHGYHGIFDI